MTKKSKKTPRRKTVHVTLPSGKVMTEFQIEKATRRIVRRALDLDIALYDKTGKVICGHKRVCNGTFLAALGSCCHSKNMGRAIDPNPPKRLRLFQYDLQPPVIPTPWYFRAADAIINAGEATEEAIEKAWAALRKVIANGDFHHRS